MIEPKGLNPFMVRSVLRLMITSNEEWVVPATADERRYFVLDVSTKYAQNSTYFRALRDEMKNGGRAALLDYLQNYNIDDFEVRDVPATAGLADQKVQGLKNVHRWWYGMLENGEIDLGGRNGFGEDSDASQWHEKPIHVDRKEFRDAYARWLQRRRFDGDELTPNQFGSAMREMVQSLDGSRPRKSQKGARPRDYVIPPLDLARNEFSVFMKQKISWPEVTFPVQSDAEDDLSHFDPDEDDLLF